MHSNRLICILGTLLIGASAVASAQNAFTSRPLNVRAGPDRAYPLVAQLGAGAPVDVMGCLSDWSWCDVTFDGTRGWAYAPGLNYVYQGQQVPLYSYAPGFGIPVVTFSLGAYWDHYYRGRPWFGQRAMWLHRRLPPHRRPPGPPPQARVPPHLHAQQFGRPVASQPRAAARGPAVAPPHGESGRYAQRAGSARPEAAEHPPVARRAPVESRARGAQEHPPAERAQNEHGGAANIRSADRRGARPTNERSGSDRAGTRANERQAPSDEHKREPPPG